jgi:hypothetical protein
MPLIFRYQTNTAGNNIIGIPIASAKIIAPFIVGLLRLENEAAQGAGQSSTLAKLF